jgi:hypothetical protein
MKAEKEERQDKAHGSTDLTNKKIKRDVFGNGERLCYCDTMHNQNKTKQKQRTTNEGESTTLIAYDNRKNQTYVLRAINVHFIITRLKKK